MKLVKINDVRVGQVWELKGKGVKLVITVEVEQ